MSNGDLYSWTVVESLGDPPKLGAVGVCDDRNQAIRDLSGALKASPDGAFGLLHKVKLNPVARGYWYDELLARAHVDPKTGDVVATGREPTGRWAPPGDVFAEIMRAAGSGAGAA